MKKLLKFKNDGVSWLVWQLSKVYHTFKKTEEECMKIENTVSPRLTSIDKTLSSIDKSFHALTFLASKHSDLKTDLFRMNSPMQLTDFGNEILIAIGGKKYIDENDTALIYMLDKKSIKSALDVEIQSRVLLLQEFSRDAFTPIKNYIYQNPIYKKEGFSDVTLDMSTISNLMSIYLRDQYFAVRPELRNAGS